MYQYREVKLGKKQEKGILVIEFTDPDMKVVGEFLMADGALLGETVLKELDELLQGKKMEAKVSGNRCGLYMTKDTTTINDLLSELYEDVTGLPSYTINTSLLQEILIEWLQVHHEYYAK